MYGLITWIMNTNREGVIDFAAFIGDVCLFFSGVVALKADYGVLKSLGDNHNELFTTRVESFIVIKKIVTCLNFSMQRYEYRNILRS